MLIPNQAGRLFLAYSKSTMLLAEVLKHRLSGNPSSYQVPNPINQAHLGVARLFYQLQWRIGRISVEQHKPYRTVILKLN